MELRREEKGDGQENQTVGGIWEYIKDDLNCG